MTVREDRQGKVDRDTESEGLIYSSLLLEEMGFQRELAVRAHVLHLTGHWGCALPCSSLEGG